MVYMLFCSIKCVIMALSLSSGHIILFSLIITYGGKSASVRNHNLPVLTPSLCIVYAFSSVLALDPWHMITSFGPYLLLTPTYVNILNMYDFPYLAGTLY